MISRQNFPRLRRPGFVARAAAVAATLPVLCSVPGTLHAQQWGAAVDRASAAYARVTTLTGKLEQHVRNLLTGSQHVTRADFQQSLPGRISVRFSEPRGDMLIADGTSVWIYTPSATPGVVTKAPLSAASVWVNMISWLVNEPRNRFNLSDLGTEKLDGIDVQIVSFVPKEPMPEIRKAAAWIETGTGIIRQVEITEPSLVRRIKFTTLELNGRVTESLFRFEVPRGVRVDEVGGPESQR